MPAKLIGICLGTTLRHK